MAISLSDWGLLMSHRTNRLKQIHAVGLITLAILGSACLWIVSLNSQMRECVHQSYLSIIKIQSIRVAMEDLEVGFRGFAIAGRPEFLQPYHQAHEVLPELMVSLRTDIESDAHLRARFGATMAAIQRLLGIGAEVVSTVQTDGHNTPRPRQLVISGKQLMDEFRWELNGLEHDRRHLLRERERRAAQLINWLTISVGIVLAFGFFYFAFSYFWLRHLASERRRTQAAFERVQAQINCIYRYAKDGMGYMQLDGRLTEVNDAFCALTGRSREELLSKTKTWIPLTAPEQRAGQEAAIRRVTETGQPEEFQKEYLRPDGSRVPVTLSLFGIPDSVGKITAVGGIARDMTERLAWEAALKQSETRFRTLTEVMPAGLFRVDTTGRVLYANECWANTNGLPEKSAIGSSVWTSMHPEDRPRVQEEWFHLGRGHEAVTTEFRIVCPDGTISWVISRTVKEYDGKGVFVGFVGTLTDITERRQIEERLREQSRELERSNGELERFAAVASHDLKEPLRLIRAYLCLLRQNEANRLDDQSREYLRYATDGAERLRTLVNDLVAYSRAGQEKVPIRTTEAAYCLRDALRNLQPQIESSGARVSAENLPSVLASPGLLTQLFQNLIHNAIKYSRPGNPQIEIRATRLIREWRFEVHDNGVGISEARQQTIFEMFSREHGTEVPGTGIGLATCKRIAERFGGRIWVESTEGKGSTFYFTLPAAARSSTLETAAPLALQS